VELFLAMTVRCAQGQPALAIRTYLPDSRFSFFSAGPCTGSVSSFVRVRVMVRVRVRVRVKLIIEFKILMSGGGIVCSDA